MTIEIKKCTVANLATLKELSIETYTDTFKDFNTPEDLKDYLDNAYNTQILTAELTNPNSEFYFLYVDKELAGYLKINVSNAQSESLGPDFLEIQRIYIRVPFKRMGLGKILLELGIKRAKELQKKRVWLGVWENNFAAQKFYQYMGFKKFTSHKFVMGDSIQTDYILKKELE